MASTKLPWPIITLDFEASGLGEFTYPIEIGIAVWNAPDAAIETWSALIKPPPNWRDHRIWQQSAVEIHGIEREELDHGLSPAEALRHANATIGEHVAFCDGGEHDLRWLLHLAHAADLRPTFKLADWDGLGGALSRQQYAQMVHWLDAEPSIHRAGADAERLMRAFAIGLAASSSESD